MKASSVVLGRLREGQGAGDGVQLLPGVEGVKNEDDIAFNGLQRLQDSVSVINAPQIDVYPYPSYPASHPYRHPCN
jgi:hypothetical protein